MKLLGKTETKFWNLVRLLKSSGKTETIVRSHNEGIDNEKEKRKNRQKREREENKTKAKTTNNGSTLKKPDGFKNKEEAGKLAKPNLFERIDREELGRVKGILKKLFPELKRAYPEAFTSENLRAFKKIYAPALRRIYGDGWLPLAVMYELFNRRAPQYGYSRKVNKNFLGLLISFVLRDSPSDFDEFYRRFVRIFRIEPQKIEVSQERKEELQDKQEEGIGLSLLNLKEFLKKKLEGKKVIYRNFIEEGIRALERMGNRWIVKCKDNVVKEYISQNFIEFLKEFLQTENIVIEGA